MGKPHLLDIVDAAYAPATTPQSWLEHVVQVTRPLLDCSEGIVGFRFDASHPSAIELGSPVFGGADIAAWRGMRAATKGLTPSAVRRTYLGSQPFGSVAQRFRGRAYPIYVELARRCYRPHGFADLLVMHVVDAAQQGCVFAAPMPRSRAATRKELVQWSRIVGHVRAGYRLSLRAAASPEAPEAILTPGGRLLHAEGLAKRAGGRDALRLAATMMDRSRAAERRSDSGFFKDLWEELIAGRWTLVDRFESDGRRFLVAYRNDPYLARHAKLTYRERDVVNYVLRGLSNKFIAQELTISEATVSEHLAIALGKLNLRSVAELAQVVPVARR